MPMTKKERAEFDAAIRQAETIAALRWTAPVERDVLPPKEGKYVNGWDFNSYYPNAFKAWTGSFVHGDGWVLDGKRPPCASQRGKALFSTRQKAIAALRHAVEQESALKLLAIDKLTKETA